MNSRVPLIGAVTVLAAVALLAACSGQPESADRPQTGADRSAKPTSSTPTTPPSGRRSTPGQKPSEKQTGPGRTGDRIGPVDEADQPSGGFTIRHLENGHVKQIDVPDFKR